MKRERPFFYLTDSGSRGGAALALTVLAISAPTAGLIALIGPLGLGLGAALERTA